MTAALACLPDADAALTAGLGRLLAAVLRPGDCLLLQGPVGAGKTHFARALIRASAGDPDAEVPSPTFTLVQSYDTPRGEIWHADLYRLTDPAELVELGLDEALAQAITLIEWPERMDPPPPDTLTVALRETAPERRAITLTGDPDRWTDIPRLTHIAQFLHGAGWSEAQVLPLAGDASTRRYFRLRDADRSAVLMDAPPGSCEPYLAMTSWLRDRGFAAPAVLAQDPAQGLLLLEDLGDDLVARVLQRDPARAAPLHDRITDLLVDLHRHPPPDTLPRLDGPALADQVGLFAEWYAPAAGAPGRGAGIGAAVRTLHEALCADVAPVVGLRDFHAENIVDRGDDLPLGLLDFQDAVAVHPAYDLVSVLQDARRDVDVGLERAQIDRYLAATGLPRDRFTAAYALLGAARNLRITGIFVRLCLTGGKPRYLQFLPRVWDAVRRDVAHPALAPLAAALDDIPAPTPDLIERIAARCGQTHPTG
nr:tRNA (adenosine(37)-N6)-threonylcarbamoyltransferase complex ATPase subunit type 1 TsaE [uncultured Paracoccus sp.]